MTVESQVNKTEAMVMGSSATYDFSFHVLLNDPTENEAKQAIKVSISDGETTTQLEYGTDYTVSLNDDGNGGTVTVADMKTSDYSLIIYREYDFKQGSDYQNYNSFPADTLEGNLDKNVMVAQQLNEKLDRAVLLDMFSTSSPNEYAAKIEALYDIRNEIVTDAQISAAITDVSGNKTNINAVAANKTNINAVAANETNINAVKANEENINTTATNIAAVNTAAEHITAIEDAPTQAANAAASATLAQEWASKTDGAVEGGEYSAKYYAELITPIASDISALAEIKDDITDVASIKADVSAVALKVDDVSTAAAGINDIVLCAYYMDAIRAAPTKASEAAASALAAAQAQEQVEFIASFEELFGGTFGDDTDNEIFGGNL